jgi:hypothetical protein
MRITSLANGSFQIRHERCVISTFQVAGAKFL